MTMPRTTITAGLAPFSVSMLVSRAANWPPVDCWSAHEDHAIVDPGLLTAESRVRLDRGGWISGPCLDPDTPQ